MKELVQVWGRVAGRYCAVSRPNQLPKKETSPKTRGLVYLGLSLASLAVALFIMFAKPYDLLFKLKITFTEGGEIFEQWRKPEVKLYLKVYLFNVTNSEAFLAGKEEIHVEEVGPYIYREYLEHTNVTFNENGTLTMAPLHPLEWQEELSAPRRRDDVLVLPNIAMLSLAYIASERGAFFRLGINTLLTSTSSQSLLAMTAEDFMFGYSSPLVSMGHSFGLIKFDKLGLIDRMYDFSGDYATIYTGETDVRQAGLLELWRGEQQLPQWPGSCGAVTGSSDGTKFPGGLTPKDKILFYRKSMCRAAHMKYAGEEELQGLEAYRYEFEEDALDNGHRNANNSCFCRQGACLPDGLIDVRDCYYGYPIALSYPHLYGSGAPPGFRVAGGMRPRRDQHHSAMWVQPLSGLPLRVRQRFQINMVMLRDLSGLPRAARFSRLVLPLLWFDIGMDGLPESMAARFRLYLNTLPRLERGLMWLHLALAGPLLVAAVFWLLRAARPSSQPARRPSEAAANAGYGDSNSSEEEQRGISSSDEDLEVEVLDAGEQFDGAAHHLLARLPDPEV